MKAFPGDPDRPRLGFGRVRPGKSKKRIGTEKADLEFWPWNGTFGVQKRTREVKSVSTDPFSAPTEPPESSFGRFGPKTDDFWRFWARKIWSEVKSGRRGKTSCLSIVEPLEMKNLRFLTLCIEKPRILVKTRIQE